jgi:hypothetical protein
VSTLALSTLYVSTHRLDSNALALRSDSHPQAEGKEGKGRPFYSSSSGHAIPQPTSPACLPACLAWQERARGPGLGWAWLGCLLGSLCGPFSNVCRIGLRGGLRRMRMLINCRRPAVCCSIRRLPNLLVEARLERFNCEPSQQAPPHHQQHTAQPSPGHPMPSSSVKGFLTS